MATLFLSLLYLSFISLGLPDSLLGTAWPLMRSEYGAPFAAAGPLAMTIAGGTIVSSLASGWIHRFLGTGPVTAFSCLLTASALLGFAFSPSFLWLFLFALPLGLGAGSVDAALNNYVAQHYEARHMSWLHCFWGLGATLGPLILSAFIAGPDLADMDSISGSAASSDSWRKGYLTISGLQFALGLLLLATLPLWTARGARFRKTQDEAAVPIPDRVPDRETDYSAPEMGKKENRPASPPSSWKIAGVMPALTAFLFYCGAEAAMGLWGSSFLIGVKGFDPAAAAKGVSLYFAGITVGRFLTGFFTFRAGNAFLVRAGQGLALFGAVTLMLPLPSAFALAGFALVGLGFAPIFPCMLHQTPARFGKERAPAIIGFQMAAAYTGTTFLPPLVGWASSAWSLGLFPVIVTLLIFLMIGASERVEGIMRARSRSKG